MRRARTPATRGGLALAIALALASSPAHAQDAAAANEAPVEPATRDTDAPREVPGLGLPRTGSAGAPVPDEGWLLPVATDAGTPPSPGDAAPATPAPPAVVPPTPTGFDPAPPSVRPSEPPAPEETSPAGHHRRHLEERDMFLRLFGRKDRPAPAPQLHLLTCVTDAQKRRWAEVKRAESDPTQFRPTAVWLPPFFMTDAERSYFWAGLVYFRTYDFEADTATTVFPPFLVSLCEPESETLITPLYGHRVDAEGTARLVLTYFQRRDRLAETDVLFPFVWSMRERASVDAEWDDVFGAVPPFAFWRHRPNGEHYRVFPPFYFNWGSKTEDTTVVPPVYASSWKGGGAFGVVPFYFEGHDGETSYRLVPPLLLFHAIEGSTETTWIANTYFQRRQRGYSLVSFPFVFAQREGAVHSWVAPLILTAHKGDDAVEETWVANAWFKGTRTGWAFHFLPLLFLEREPDRSHTFVPPVFWRWSEGATTTTIVGPGFWREQPGRFDFGVAPLYFHGQDDAGAYDVSPPLFWSWRDHRTHHLLLPPLFTYHEGDGSTETTFALNTYFQSRPTGFTLASVPFLFAGREGDAGYAVVPPLFWRFSAPDATTTVLANVYTRRSPERFDLGVVPLFFHGRDVEGGGYDVSPPLFWRWNDRTTHHLLLPPLLAYHEGDGTTETTFAVNTYYQSRADGFTLTAFPLLFAGQEGARGYTVVPPLYWRFTDPEATLTIAGPVFWRATAERIDVGFTPIYFRGRTDEGGYDVSPLLFWRWNDRVTHHLLLPPLLAYHEGDGTTETTFAVNTYYQSRPDGFTLTSFPFLFAGEDLGSSYTVVPPLFWRFRDADATLTVAANTFWRTARQRFDLGVVPLFFHGRDAADEGGYDVSPPLFWRWNDRTTHHLLIPPLLAYHGGDGSTETTWVANTYYQSRPRGFTLTSFPLLFAGAEGDERHVVVPPLYWHFADADSTFTLAANVYARRARDRFDLGVVPLFFHGRDADGEGGYDVSPALFWRWNDARTHHLLLPPLLAYHEGDGTTETTYALNTYYQSRPGGFTLTSFPFLFAGAEGPESHVVVPPVFWRFDAPDATTTVVLNTFWRSARDRFDLGVVPLFFHGRDAVGDGGYDVSPPLFWRWGDERRHHLLIPPLLTYHGGDGTTETTWALNTWYQSRPQGFSLTVFPLLFAGAQGDESYAVVPPLFWRYRDPGRETLVAGPWFRHDEPSGSVFGLAPLYFGGRSATASWDLVPPVFYRSEDADGSHLTVFPLFDYRETRTSRLFLSPLAVHSKDSEHERTVVGGLYWRFTGPESDATVLFPVWWDFHAKDTGTRLTTVFPLYWRYEKPDETTNVLVNVMWSYGMTPLGPSWSFHVFPFFDLASYHPRHFLWQVLAGMLGHERLGDAERWRVVWVWTQPQRKEPPGQPVAAK